MEHLLGFILKILLWTGEVQCLGRKCDSKVYAYSLIKVQVTIFFCLALSWILKPDEAKHRLSSVSGPMGENNLQMGQKLPSLHQDEVKQPSQQINRINSTLW